MEEAIGLMELEMQTPRYFCSEDEEEDEGGDEGDEGDEGAVVPSGAFTTSDDTQGKAELVIISTLHLYPSLHLQPPSQRETESTEWYPVVQEHSVNIWPSDLGRVIFHDAPQ